MCRDLPRLPDKRKTYSGWSHSKDGQNWFLEPSTRGLYDEAIDDYQRLLRGRTSRPDLSEANEDLRHTLKRDKADEESSHLVYVGPGGLTSKRAALVGWRRYPEAMRPRFERAIIPY